MASAVSASPRASARMAVRTTSTASADIALPYRAH